MSSLLIDRVCEDVRDLVLEGLRRSSNAAERYWLVMETFAVVGGMAAAHQAHASACNVDGMSDDARVAFTADFYREMADRLGRNDRREVALS